MSKVSQSALACPPNVERGIQTVDLSDNELCKVTHRISPMTTSIILLLNLLLLLLICRAERVTLGQVKEGGGGENCQPGTSGNRTAALPSACKTLPNGLTGGDFQYGLNGFSP